MPPDPAQDAKQRHSSQKGPRLSTMEELAEQVSLFLSLASVKRSIAAFLSMPSRDRKHIWDPVHA